MTEEKTNGFDGEDAQKLQVIPPIVVVSKILVYCRPLNLKKRITKLFPFIENDSITKEESNRLKFSLFGYFKRDFTRKIFFLFPSLEFGLLEGKIQEKLVESFPVIDARKVLHLKLKELDEKTVPSSMFEMEGMKELQSLELKTMKHMTGEKFTSLPDLKYLTFYDMDNFTDKFFQTYELPKLKKMSIFRSERIEGRNWKCGFQNTIVRISLSFTRVCDDLFQRFEFKNLQELTFGGGIITGRKWKPMKKLNFLSIYQINLPDELFRDQPFQELERLLLEDVSGFDGSWNKEFKKLDELSMINVNVDDSLFISNVFPVLDELKIFCGPTRMTGLNWNEMPKMEDFSTGKDFPNIEEIKKKFPEDAEVNLY